MSMDKFKINIRPAETIKFQFDAQNKSRIDIKTSSLISNTDYNNLSNLPSLGGTTIKGALSYEDLFLLKANINTKEYWDAKIDFVPERGEIVIYENKTTIDGVIYPGVKIGDGNAYLVDLPFVGDDLYVRIIDALESHINDSSIHVTEDEKKYWNNKLDSRIDGENLIFSPLM